jgi:hypothetical protein
MLTGADCGACRVVVAAPVVVRVVPSGAAVGAGAFAGADVVEAVVAVAGWSNPLQLVEGDCHVMLAQAENATHSKNDLGHLA